MSRYYIPASPAAERERQMGRLMGLGGADDAESGYVDKIFEYGSKFVEEAKSKWDATPFSGKVGILAPLLAGRTVSVGGKEYKVDCVLREMAKISPDGSKFSSCASAMSGLASAVSGDVSGLPALLDCIPSAIGLLGSSTSCVKPAAAKPAASAAPAPMVPGGGGPVSIRPRLATITTDATRIGKAIRDAVCKSNPSLCTPKAKMAGAGLLVAAVLGAGAWFYLRKKK